MHIPARDFGKSRRRVHLDLETEMLRIEVDCGTHVIHDVAKARGHGSVLSSLGLARSSGTYPYHSDTSTSHKSVLGPARARANSPTVGGRARSAKNTANCPSSRTSSQRSLVIALFCGAGRDASLLAQWLTVFFLDAACATYDEFAKSRSIDVDSR